MSQYFAAKKLFSFWLSPKFSLSTLFYDIADPRLNSTHTLEKPIALVLPSLDTIRTGKGTIRATGTSQQITFTSAASLFLANEGGRVRAVKAIKCLQSAFRSHHINVRVHFLETRYPCGVVGVTASSRLSTEDGERPGQIAAWS